MASGRSILPLFIHSFIHFSLFIFLSIYPSIFLSISIYLSNLFIWSENLHVLTVSIR